MYDQAITVITEDDRLERTASLLVVLRHDD